MSRSRSPDRDKAVKLWLKSGRQMKPAEIAEKIGVSASMVRKWKSMDEWDKLPEPKPGAPRGNRNAKGNKGGSAPLMNENAVKHGLFRKFLPDDDETREIYDMTADISPLDILWEGIRIKWTNFLRAQKIQYVRDNKDVTKVLKKKKPGMFGTEQEWEYQQPWDKQASALNSQSAAMNGLTRMIKQYEEMLRAISPEDVTEERCLRVEKLKAEVKALGALGDNVGVQIIDDIGSGIHAG